MIFFLYYWPVEFIVYSDNLNWFEMIDALENPVELWITFKREALEAGRGCVGGRPRSRDEFASAEKLDSIKKSHTARLAGNRDQYRTLSRRTRTLLRRDKVRYIRSLAADVESHLNANDFKPAYRALRKLHLMSASRSIVIQTADGCLVLDVDGQIAHWAEFFEQLFKVNPRNFKPLGYM